MRNIKSKVRKGYKSIVEDKLLSFVFKESGIAFSLKVIASIFGFIFNVILARMLTPSDLGVYFLAFTANNLSGLIAKHGLANLAIKYIAAYAIVSDYKSLRSFYRFSQALILSVSLLISVSSLVIVFVLFKYEMVSNDLFFPLVLSVCLGTLPAAMSDIYAQYLKGISLTRSAVLVLSFYRPFLSIPLSILLIFVWGLNGAIISFVLASTITWAIAHSLWKKGINRKESQSENYKTVDSIPKRKIYKSSIYLLLNSFMLLMIKQSPTFALGILSTSDNIGLYNIAFRTSFLLAFILSSVEFVVSSKYSEFFKLSRLDLVSSLAQKTTLLMSLAMFPLLLILISFSTNILALFGKSYTAASLALITLSIAQLVNVATGSVKTILTMSGNEKYVLFSTSVSGVLSMGLCFGLIPQLDLFGAALSAAIAIATQNIMMIVFTYRRLGISTIPLLKVKAPLR